MRELVDFIKAALSNNQPESFNRTACAIVLYFLLCWTTYIVSATKVIPDIPMQWAFLVGGLYLGGKALDRSKGVTDVPASQVVPAQ